jgi:hypothetical protein
MRLDQAEIKSIKQQNVHITNEDMTCSELQEGQRQVVWIK